MWSFTHDPAFADRYRVHLTQPALCAAELLADEADLGLIPIAALTPSLVIVPGCTIASLSQVRSIQLISRLPLQQVRTVAADTASRSSVAYAQVLFRHFLGTDPTFLPAAANVPAMLAQADAALIIGDPALLALQARPQIESQTGPLHWYDIAHEWHRRTGLPWVAAVWAARPQAVRDRAQLIADLNHSREQGQLHIEDLVQQWIPRIALPPAIIRSYLTANIHYTLDAPCIQAIQLFRQLAAEANILPPLGPLNLLA